MSRTYFTREGETLDAIAHRVYGNARAVHALLDANPLISRQPERLPAGLTLVLPDLAPAPGQAVQTVRLWGDA